ncbi:hypothetical protein GCM10010168_23880 [Actinoplanes ianthinogenes]|uniref:Ig-like domain-containing protein n=1 Tax=Actinoplanes ianthinogenes TaxID=122358 RepID=A0ABM7M8U1_9ACTN|nr:hypothetical protein Aiant_86860 [Actinoplanes ianthinogenes]GGR05872.1 hypothetical protein GCM10010168_23880 [Actinoplanes ianthinogenes]
MPTSAGEEPTIPAPAESTVASDAPAPDVIAPDAEPPSAEFVLPAEVSGQVTVTLVAPSADTASMEVRIGGRSAGYTESAPWSTLGHADGPALVEVVTVDRAGNVGTATQAVTVTNGPAPVVPDLSPTTDPSTPEPDPATSDPSATDPSATDPSATDPSATDPSTSGPSAPEPTTVPAASDPAPAEPTTVTATTDPAVPDTWNLDPDPATTAPAPALTTGAPGTTTVAPAPPTTSPPPADRTPPSSAFAMAGAVRGAVTVALTTAAPDTASMQLQVDGAQRGMTLRAPWSLPWSTIGTTDGWVTVKVTTTDRAGNRAETTRVVRVDNTAPTAAITAPSAVHGTVTVSAGATDATGIAQAQLLVDGRTAGTTTRAPYQFRVATTGTGTHTWTLRVTDLARNVRTVTKTVAYDNAAPTLKVTPARGARVSATFTVRAAAADRGTGVATIRLYAGTRLVKQTTRATLTATVRTGKKPYRFTVRVTDRAGNVTSVTRTVTR